MKGLKRMHALQLAAPSWVRMYKSGGVATGGAETTLKMDKLYPSWRNDDPAESKCT